MEQYYKERFEAQRRLAQTIAGALEVNEILEVLRAEAMAMIPSALQACILLLDPQAIQYTRPMQCGLYDRPINCQSCKRDRSAVQKAMNRDKTVVVNRGEPVTRPDGTVVEIGPEIAIPVKAGEENVAVLNVVAKPGARFSRKELFLFKDLADTVGDVILRAKRHWEVTQEKIRISQVLGHLSPFVPLSVRSIVEKNPELGRLEKQRKDVTVLFLDLEGYTHLSAQHSETEVNEIIEGLFSNFVDPIQRSHGDIVETAGDGLLIVFQGETPGNNAINAVKAAFDINDITQKVSQMLGGEFAPIKVNIGINSGTALVGMTQFKGSLGSRTTYTASGPVTNLAARLAEYAEGGEILVGEETRRLIGDIWPVEERGRVRLKGIDEEVRIYSVTHKHNKDMPSTEASDPSAAQTA
jgi:class 3 adenylate cyclase